MSKEIPVLLAFDNDKVIGSLQLTDEGMEAVNYLKEKTLFSIGATLKKGNFELLVVGLINGENYKLEK